MSKIFVEQKKKYSEIEQSNLNKIKENKLPLVCLSGINNEHPLNFNFVVYDKNNKLKAKFIDIEDAIEYAEFLTSK